MDELTGQSWKTLTHTSHIFSRALIECRNMKGGDHIPTLIHSHMRVALCSTYYHRHAQKHGRRLLTETKESMFACISTSVFAKNRPASGATEYQCGFNTQQPCEMFYLWRFHASRLICLLNKNPQIVFCWFLFDSICQRNFKFFVCLFSKANPGFTGCKFCLPAPEKAPASKGDRFVSKGVFAVETFEWGEEVAGGGQQEDVPPCRVNPPSPPASLLLRFLPWNLPLVRTSRGVQRPKLPLRYLLLSPLCPVSSWPWAGGGRTRPSHDCVCIFTSRAWKRRPTGSARSRCVQGHQQRGGISRWPLSGHPAALHAVRVRGGSETLIHQSQQRHPKDNSRGNLPLSALISSSFFLLLFFF